MFYSVLYFGILVLCLVRFSTNWNRTAPIRSKLSVDPVRLIAEELSNSMLSIDIRVPVRLFLTSLFQLDVSRNGKYGDNILYLVFFLTLFILRKLVFKVFLILF